jgi:nucleoside 2-deoxyribosyltransferase
VKVYVAGPYSKSDQVANVRAAIEAADRLADAGHSPYVPHLTMLWHLVSPKPYDAWIAHDLEWLATCDAVVRIPGDSPGADGEVAEAGRLGIPVFYSVEDVALPRPMERPAVLQ